jgi:hypothetical protein
LGQSKANRKDNNSQQNDQSTAAPYPSPLIQDQLSMNNDPMAGPIQGLIPGIPAPPSFANQRINDHDRIPFTAENPFKVRKD